MEKMSELLPGNVESTDILQMVERSVLNIREDMRDNPYVLEAIKVLPVGGHRSAIGAFWNAVVDDLRNKIIYRSLSLFNKSVSLQKEIKTYEDFQDNVNDDQLIDGAYKIGVIGWEASKILRHTKETRHVFYGHPHSSDPSIIKVYGVIDDCVKYVLNAEYPHQIIDVDEYIEQLGKETFDRNEIAIQNAVGDLPEIYKNEFGNRLFSIYSHPESPSTLISNVEFVAPILWSALPKSVKIQIVRRLDQEIPKGDVKVTKQAFKFVTLVNATAYLSANAREYHIDPLVQKLKEHLDDWETENKLVYQLAHYSSVVPGKSKFDYVWALTHTYVGRVGASAQYNRTDFYANGAAGIIPNMFQSFDDEFAEYFISTIRESELLKNRIRNPSKLKRLRSLAIIIDEKVSTQFEYKNILDALIDETCEEEFFKLVF